MYSVGQLIPEDQQERLISLGQINTMTLFSIGDEANSAVRWNTEQGHVASKDQIYSAIGSLCGKSARTVREYASLAGFYSASVREEFEILSFDHFRTARALGGGDGWRKVLEYAISAPRNGRPASVDELEAKFSGAIMGADSSSAAEELFGVPVSVIDGSTGIQFDEAIIVDSGAEIERDENFGDVEDSGNAGSWLERKVWEALGTLEAFKRKMHHIKVSQESQRRIEQLLLELEEEIKNSVQYSVR